MNIEYDDAKKACAQRGMRLCEPDEFERACRGERRASYPYGSRMDPKKCNAKRSGEHKAVPGGAYAECVSAAGVFDMAGNVAEWVAGEGIRGGSFDTGDGRCSNRDHRSTSRAYHDVGYRCCSRPKEN